MSKNATNRSTYKLHLLLHKHDISSLKCPGKPTSLCTTTRCFRKIRSFSETPNILFPPFFKTHEENKYQNLLVGLNASYHSFSIFNILECKFRKFSNIWLAALEKFYLKAVSVVATKVFISLMKLIVVLLFIAFYCYNIINKCCKFKQILQWSYFFSLHNYIFLVFIIIMK